jgi:hypothetical protein
LSYFLRTRIADLQRIVSRCAAPGNRWTGKRHPVGALGFGLTAGFGFLAGAGFFA